MSKKAFIILIISFVFPCLAAKKNIVISDDVARFVEKTGNNEETFYRSGKSQETIPEQARYSWLQTPSYMYRQVADNQDIVVLHRQLDSYVRRLKNRYHVSVNWKTNTIRVKRLFFKETGEPRYAGDEKLPAIQEAKEKAEAITHTIKFFRGKVEYDNNAVTKTVSNETEMITGVSILFRRVFDGAVIRQAPPLIIAFDRHGNLKEMEIRWSAYERMSAKEISPNKISIKHRWKLFYSRLTTRAEKRENDVVNIVGVAKSWRKITGSNNTDILIPALTVSFQVETEKDELNIIRDFMLYDM